jgi:hypothetical protein
MKWDEKYYCFEVWVIPVRVLPKLSELKQKRIEEIVDE